MIRKWYEITCDCEECSSAIGHYDADSIKGAVEQAEEDGAVIRYVVGKRRPFTFCNEKCLSKYAKEHGYEY